MRLISTQSVSTHPLLNKLGLGMLPRWLRGKRRQHHYRLQIRCEDRADLDQVLEMVSHTLQPAGLHPVQSMTPGRSGGRELVLNLRCTPPSAAIWCSLSIRSGPLIRFAGNCALAVAIPSAPDSTILCQPAFRGPAMLAP